MTLLGWAGVAGVILIRIFLWLIGLVVVPFTDPYDNPVWGNREHPVPPNWFAPDRSRGLRDWLWRAIRNPTNNLRYLLNDVSEGYTTENPPDLRYQGVWFVDHSVRTDGATSAYRYVPGLAPEYWYLRRIRLRLLGRVYHYFEFRIGWKYSGVPGFLPTLQLRLESA